MYLDKSVGVFGLVFQHFLGKLSHDAVELIGTVGRDYAPVKNGNVIYSEFERNQICGLLATYITAHTYSRLYFCATFAWFLG